MKYKVIYSGRDQPERQIVIDMPDSFAELDDIMQGQRLLAVLLRWHWHNVSAKSPAALSFDFWPMDQ